MEPSRQSMTLRVREGPMGQAVNHATRDDQYLRPPKNSLALASWCARNDLKRPSASPLAARVRAVRGPEASGPIPHGAALLPTPPAPAPPAATNSSPGACTGPRPPKRGMAPPACSRSPSPTASAPEKRGGRPGVSPDPRSDPGPPGDPSPSPTRPAAGPPPRPPSPPTTDPAGRVPTHADGPGDHRRP